MTSWTAQIIRDIEAFCVKLGLSEREFSELTVSPKFMSRLRRGQTTARSIEAAHAFMHRHADSTPAEMRALVESVRAQRQAA